MAAFNKNRVLYPLDDSSHLPLLAHVTRHFTDPFVILVPYTPDHKTYQVLINKSRHRVFIFSKGPDWPLSKIGGTPLMAAFLFNQSSDQPTTQYLYCTRSEPLCLRLIQSQPTRHLPLPGVEEQGRVLSLPQATSPQSEQDSSMLETPEPPLIPVSILQRSVPEIVTPESIPTPIAASTPTYDERVIAYQQAQRKLGMAVDETLLAAPLSTTDSAQNTLEVCKDTPTCAHVDPIPHDTSVANASEGQTLVGELAGNPEETPPPYDIENKDYVPAAALTTVRGCVGGVALAEVPIDSCSNTTIMTLNFYNSMPRKRSLGRHSARALEDSHRSWAMFTVSSTRATYHSIAYPHNDLQYSKAARAPSSSARTQSVRCA